MINRENLLSKCEGTIEFAATQLRNLVESHPDYFPMYTQNGKWQHGGEAWTNWCEGFLGGQLWLIFQATGDEYFREKAEHYSRLVEHRKSDRNVHDLGFLFFSTWKRWYDLSGKRTRTRSSSKQARRSPNVLRRRANTCAPSSPMKASSSTS